MTPFKSLPEVLCPWCVKQGGLAIYLQMVTKPIGSFSLAGAQMKVSAVQVPVLACSLCDSFVTGRVEGDQAVFPDPHVQAETVDA